MTTPVVKPRWTAGRRKAAARHARLGLLAADRAARTAEPVTASDLRTSCADFRVALDIIRAPR